MFPERLRKFFISEEKRPVPPESQVSESCIGYLDRTQRFQFTTFSTDLDKERIMQDLQSAGFSIVGVMDGERTRRLAMMDSASGHYASSRF